MALDVVAVSDAAAAAEVVEGRVFQVNHADNMVLSPCMCVCMRGETES